MQTNLAVSANKKSRLLAAFFMKVDRDSNYLNATRMSVASDGWTELNNYFHSQRE